VRERAKKRREKATKKRQEKKKSVYVGFVHGKGACKHAWTFFLLFFFFFFPRKWTTISKHGVNSDDAPFYKKIGLLDLTTARSVSIKPWDFDVLLKRRGGRKCVLKRGKRGNTVSPGMGKRGGDLCS